MQPDTAAQTAPASEQTMPTPETPPVFSPTPTPDIVTSSPISPQIETPPSMASEQQSYDESRAEDPLVKGAMGFLTDLSKVAKGDDFVRIASSGLKFAQDYAEAKNKPH